MRPAVERKKQVENDRSKDFRVLVVAPSGQDAKLICDVLRESGIQAEALGSAAEACLEVENGAGSLIVAEEALTPNAIEQMAKTAEHQPPWSDFPLILLTISGAVSAESLQREEIRHALGNVLLLERPVRPETLISTAQIALRARSRQYEIRDYSQQLREAEADLRLNDLRLKLTQGIARIGSWELDIDTDRYIWSAEALEILGRPHATISTPGEFHALMYVLSDRQNAERAINDAIRKNKDFEFHFRVQRDDGEFRWIAARGKPFYNLGQPLVIGVVFDITTAQKALLSSDSEKRTPNGRYRDAG